MNLGILIIFITLFASSFGYAQERFTADYYKADPATYLNKLVTVKIYKADPSSFCPLEGYVAYHCFTANSGKNGGYFYILVAQSKSKFFYRNYHEVKSKSTLNGEGADYPTKSLKAKFIQVKWESGAQEYCLIVE